MSVAKVIEITAQSSKSFEDAVEKGVAKAGESVHGITQAWVQDFEAVVEDGKVAAYRVRMRITFILD